LQAQLQQLAQRLRDNTTHQGEIRQQLKQDSDNRLHQQALMQQIEEAARLAEDWGYLNALIGSSTGDKFRKFAQGLTLDNLVWLANQQLNRLHGAICSSVKRATRWSWKWLIPGRLTRCAIPAPFRRRELPGQPGAGAGAF
jgi:DNA repair exonuclease SbcCD ATPase subunit